MTSQSEAERDKAVVDAFYQAGIEGHLTSFARYLDPDFIVTAQLSSLGRHTFGRGVLSRRNTAQPPRCVRLRALQLRQRYR
jgi:hypothetical protein